MSSIIVKKSGKLLMVKGEKGKTKKTRCSSLKSALGFNVEFESGLTFGTIFKLILAEKKFFNTLFYCELGGTKLEDFERRFNKRSSARSNVDNIQYLEVLKMFDVEGAREDGIIEFEPVFVGVAKDPDEKEFIVPISFMSINDLKNFEIYVNKSVEVFNVYKDEEGEIVEDVLMAGYTRVTLYEVISAIINEISFFGTPEEKDRKKEEIVEQMQINDLIAKLEQDLESFVKEEKYEEAEKVKKILDGLKKEK